MTENTVPTMFATPSRPIAATPPTRREILVLLAVAVAVCLAGVVALSFDDEEPVSPMVELVGSPTTVGEPAPLDEPAPDSIETPVPAAATEAPPSPAAPAPAPAPGGTCAAPAPTVDYGAASSFDELLSAEDAVVVATGSCGTG